MSQPARRAVSRTSSGAYSSRYKLNARRDTVDFRDLMYTPTLGEVPSEIPLAAYRRIDVPLRDQKKEGACTGFALACVVHYLLRSRKVHPDTAEVSPHMLYRIARRYDEWPGEGDDGSSARGAMKGWHKHGVCRLTLWDAAGRGTSAGLLTHERAMDALERPLGAYFRVNHKDLVAMHAAISEVGILYATASVHAGWDEVGNDGRIGFSADYRGGHAFAIVAYDVDGFWLQNSWGSGWGRRGFGHISYDDWLANGDDVWVARLGAPVRLAAGAVAGAAGGAHEITTAGARSALGLAELRPHVVSIGNDGALRPSGMIGTDEGAIREIFRNDFPRITAGASPWPVKRVLLYTHGGLVSEDVALHRLQDYRKAFLASQVYPIGFVWKSDYWTTLGNALKDAVAKKAPERVIDAAKDFMLDRLDDTLEPIARLGTGKAAWDEMKENALMATTAAAGGARLVAGQLASLLRHDRSVELHVVGHSAGGIFHAPLVKLLTTRGRVGSGLLRGEEGLGLTIKTCSLWAPACTIDLFNDCYVPSIESGAIERFALFTLTDEAEQDDQCAGIYHKSLLYLVSHTFEERARIPFVSWAPNLKHAGTPILGMEWWIERDRDLSRLLKRPSDDPATEERVVWIRSPNPSPGGGRCAAASRHHGDFDDDVPTVKATLARVLGLAAAPADAAVEFGHSAATWKARRKVLSA